MDERTNNNKSNNIRQEKNVLFVVFPKNSREVPLMDAQNERFSSNTHEAKTFLASYSFSTKHNYGSGHSVFFTCFSFMMAES